MSCSVLREKRNGAFMSVLRTGSAVFVVCGLTNNLLKHKIISKHTLSPAIRNMTMFLFGLVDCGLCVACGVGSVTSQCLIQSR